MFSEMGLLYSLALLEVDRVVESGCYQYSLTFNRVSWIFQFHLNDCLADMPRV